MWAGVGNHEEECGTPELVTTGNDLLRLREARCARARRRAHLDSSWDCQWREGGRQPAWAALPPLISLPGPPTATGLITPWKLGAPEAWLVGSTQVSPLEQMAGWRRVENETVASGSYLERYKGSSSVSSGGQGPALGMGWEAGEVRKNWLLYAGGRADSHPVPPGSPLAAYLPSDRDMGHGQGF